MYFTRASLMEEDHSGVQNVGMLCLFPNFALVNWFSVYPQYSAYIVFFLFRLAPLRDQMERQNFTAVCFFPLRRASIDISVATFKTIILLA